MKQTKLFRFCALLVLALSIMVSPVFATTYYVDATNGNDSNDGSSPTNDSPGVGPFETIMTGVGAASDGDTLQIAAANVPGYDEDVSIGKALTLIGYELDSNTEVKINQQGTEVLSIDAAGKTVSIGESGTASFLINGNVDLVAGDLTIDAANVSMTNGNTITRTAGTIDETPTIEGNGDLNVTYDGTDNITAGAELPADLKAGALTNNIDAASTLTINWDIVANDVDMNQSGSMVINGNLETTGGGVDIIDDDAADAGDFEVTGNVTLAGNLVANEGSNVTVGGTVALGENQLLNVGDGDFSIAAVTATVTAADPTPAPRDVVDNQGAGEMDIGDITISPVTDGNSDDDALVAIIENSGTGDLLIGGNISGNLVTVADGGSNTDTLYINLQTDMGNGITVISSDNSIDNFVLNGTLTINGDLIITNARGAGTNHDNNNGTIDGSGTLIFADEGNDHTVNLAGTLPDLQVDRQVTLNGTPTVDGNVDANATLVVGGAATITGNVDLTGTLDVGAETTIEGDINQSGSGASEVDANLTVNGDWSNSSDSTNNINAGTFDVDGTFSITGTGSTILDVAAVFGGFNQDAGTFQTSGATNVEIEGDFTRTAGTFDLTTNDGTLEFSGDAAATLTAGPQLILHDLTISKTNDAIVTVTQSLIIENALTVASGAGVDFGTKTFTVRGSSDWNGAMTSSGAGGLLFDTDNATIAGAGTYDNITINTTNDVYIADGESVTFKGNLYLADGTLVVDDNAGAGGATDLSPVDSAEITVHLENGGNIDESAADGTFNGDGSDYDLTYISDLSGNTAVGGEFDAAHLIDLTVSTTSFNTQLPASDITVQGNLVVDGLCEINNTNRLTVNGTATISGTLTDGGSSFLDLAGDNKTHTITGTINSPELEIDGDTVVVNGSTDEADAAAITNLVVNPNKMVTIANLQEINGTVTTGNNSVVSLGLYDGGNAGEGRIDGLVTVDGNFTMTSDITVDDEVDVNADTVDFGANTLEIIDDVDGPHDFDGDAGGVKYLSDAGATLKLTNAGGNIGTAGDTLTCLLDIDGAYTMSSDIYATGGLDLDAALANDGNDLHMTGDNIDLNNNITGAGTTRIWGSTITAEQDVEISNLMIDTEGTVTLQTDDLTNPTWRTLTVSTLLTLENGVFAYGNNDVVLSNAGEALAVTDGTVSADDGILKFTGAGAVTANTDTSFVVPNLEVAVGNGNSVALTSETGFTVGEMLTLTSGDLNADDDAPLHIADGVDFTIADANLAALVDDPVYDGAVDITYGNLTVGAYTTGVEILDNMDIRDLTIDVTNITGDAAGDILIDSSVTVTNKFSLASGHFAEDNGAVTLADSATLSMAGGSFVAGDGPDVTNYYLEYDASVGNVTTSDDDFMTGMIGLNINTGGNTVTLHESRTIGGSVSIEGTGTLDLNTNTLTAEKDVDVSDVGSISVNNGTLTFAGSDTTTLTVDADWSIPATLDFTVQKDANDGHLDLAGGDLDFTGAEINLIQGVLATGDNKVILDQGASGGQPTQGFNRNVGVIYGNVEKFIDKSSTTEISNVEYPTGTPDGEYRPAKFYFKTAPPISVNLLVNHENMPPGGTNGIPFNTGTVTVTSYPDFYWKVESDVSIAPSYEFDMELQAENYAYYVTDDIESVRMIRRAEGALDNEWRLQGDDEKYDNQTVMTDWPLVKVIDAQGGITSEGSIFTFSQSSQAPRWTMATPADTVDENDTLAMDFAAIDEDINEYGAIEVVGDLPSFATFETTSENDDSATVTLAPTYADSGDYTFTLRATDGNEYTDTTISIRVNNVNQPATFVTTPADTMLNENTAFEFTYEVEDADGDSVHYAVVDSISSDVSITADGVVTFTTGTGTEAGQVDTLVVSATDSVGTPPVVNTDTLFVTVVKQVAPVFADVLPDTTINTNDTLNYTYTATDANTGETLTFGLVDTVEGVTVADDGALSWAPATNQVGDSTMIVVGVTDLSDTTVYDTAYVHVNSAVLGDASLDGSVTVFDAATVLQHVVGKDTLSAAALELADVTMNNAVSALDASYIYQYYLGIIDTLPPAMSKAVAAEGLVSWNMEKVEGKEDAMVVPVSIAKAKNVYSLEYTAEIDPAKVSIEDISIETPDSWVMSKSIEDGRLSIAMAGIKPLTNGSIGNIELKVLDKEAAAELTGTVKLNESREEDLEAMNVRQIPGEFKLSQNYPNPFNPTTTIDYQLPTDAKVVINIYNIMGQKVRTLTEKDMKAGYHSVIWNGLNDNGRQLSSGTYFYRIKAGKNVSTKKMLLIK